MLLYSLLHLTGYGLTLEELESFRQWGSRTPGHPEYGLTPGRRGDDRAARPGLRERRRAWRSPSARLAGEFNRAGHDIVDHWTYALASDGDLQEGIASEAAQPRRPPPARQARSSSTTTTTSSSTGRRTWPGPRTSLGRFEAYGWGVDAGRRTATTSRRSRRRSRTADGDGRPSPDRGPDPHRLRRPNKQDTQKAHGSPLGEDEVRLAKEAYGWDPDAHFLVPDEVARVLPARRSRRGEELVDDWERAFDALRAAPTRTRPPSSGGGLRGDLPDPMRSPG